jgi:hypothetical protein
MYDALVFSADVPSLTDAYAGGGVFMPSRIAWPRGSDGELLVHLLSFPEEWFFSSSAKDDYWISVFVPYDLKSFSHYRKLRMIEGNSEARVLSYKRADSIRNEAVLLTQGRIVLSHNLDEDDEDNLDSKRDGIDAWLQKTICISGMKRRVSIYGGDLDISLPLNKGILSDGMGYLFLDDSLTAHKNTEAGEFFLQL